MSRTKRAEGGEETANRFAVKRVSRCARSLVTIDRDHELWSIDMATFTRIVIEPAWKSNPPIVRLQPPADADDNRIAWLESKWKEIGAHTRTMARARGQKIVIEEEEVIADAPRLSMRDTVDDMIRASSSAHKQRLKALLDKAMQEEGI